jgi:hypothetical protein
MESIVNTNISSNVPEKKKRGRKKQNVVVPVENIQLATVEKPLPKKRGRKPKGGKIIQNDLPLTSEVKIEPNIILHLKCSINDIDVNYDDDTSSGMKYNPIVAQVESFNFENVEKNAFLLESDFNSKSNENKSTNDSDINCTDECKNDSNAKSNSKDNIWEKINSLKINLHNNNISDKRSACFWCTYTFDNPPIYIPKFEFKNSYEVYGCFCSPECSVAHLMNEKIDSTIKFERYQLLNHVYGKIYNYKKNIKPAPDPHYLLDKFYGSLSIKEYRDLFKNDQLLIVVEKPLTHVFPELYEDNSDFILNQRTIPSNSTLKLKRKPLDNKQTSVFDSLTSKK